MFCGRLLRVGREREVGGLVAGQQVIEAGGARVGSFYLRHLAFSVTQVLALVHRQCAGSASEAVTLWSELAAVALLAEEVAAVLSGVGAVEPLVAEAALEALLVPLGAGGQHLLGRVDRLAALRALWLLWHFERHFELLL